MFQNITVNTEQAATIIIIIIINITFLLFVHFQSTSLNLAISFIVSLLARFKKSWVKATRLCTLELPKMVSKGKVLIHQKLHLQTLEYFRPGQIESGTWAASNDLLVNPDVQFG